MSEQESSPVDSKPVHGSKVPIRRTIVTDQVEITDDQRLYAMLAHLLGIFSGPIAALVIWLIKKGDEWVEQEAREAINFQITVLLAQAIGIILLIIHIGMIVIIAASVFNIVFCVIAAAHAHAGEGYRYPLAVRLIKGSA